MEHISVFNYGQKGPEIMEIPISDIVSKHIVVRAEEFENLGINLRELLKALLTKKIFYLNTASNEIDEVNILGCRWSGYELNVLYLLSEHGGYYSLPNDSTVFLTKEEAKNALAKREDVKE